VHRDFDRHVFGNLDLTATVARMTKEVMRRERGIVFICGESGTGKTLFAYDYLEARSTPTFFTGDVRSVVTLAKALASARDAHVLGVLRIPGGTGALDRVRDMRDDTSLPSLPLSVITLRLLRRLCRVCRRRDGPYWARGRGGSCCAAGFRGKVRLAQVLVYDDMRNGRPSESSGSLVVDGERRLCEGEIDVPTFVESVHA
jgi:type II secretory ATPase GspE/PulE/Tfp pilus assembly ATPase PilB-like protein